MTPDRPLIRRLPVVATIVVLAAVGLMIWLGVWQLQRARLHAVQLAKYESAAKLPPIAFPTVPIASDKLPLYRYATGNCLHVVNRRTAPGENRSQDPGYLIVVDCVTGAEGPGMSVELGWSKNPNVAVKWTGGLVSGVIVPDNKSRMRLVAATPVAGVEQSAIPTPTVRITPARNRGYAATWFGLAALALLIYGLAVRKRLREEPPER